MPDLKLRQCEKACIANVGGKCAVQNCREPIVRVSGRPMADVEQAAKFYECAKASFDDYFGEGD